MEITFVPLKKDHLIFLLSVRNEESTRTQLKNDVIYSLDECHYWFDNFKPKWLVILNENNLGYNFEVIYINR